MTLANLIRDLGTLNLLSWGNLHFPGSPSTNGTVPWPCLVVFCCNTRQYHITAKKDKARRYICMYLYISCHRGHLSLPKTRQIASIDQKFEKHWHLTVRGPSIFTPLQEYSKGALVDFTKNKSWYSLTIWKSHLFGIERTQVGNKIKMTEPWRGTTDPFDRHLSPISLPPFYNHHCCRIVANCISEHQKSGVSLPCNQYLTNWFKN